MCISVWLMFWTFSTFQALYITTNMKAITYEKRRELMEATSKVNDNLAKLFVNDEPVSSTDL